MTSGHDYGNRLREEIRQRLGAHISELESEIKSIREALSDSLEKLSTDLQGVQDLPISEANTLFEEAIREGGEARGAETVHLSEFSSQLRTKETQEDILELLLEEAHRFAPAVALFVSRDDQLICWTSRGFNEGVSGRLKQYALARSDSPLLQAALEGQKFQTAQDVSGERVLLELVRGDTEAPWHVLPLRALGRALAALLVFSRTHHKCDLISLSLVVDLTELCIENLALKILQELSVSAGPEAASQVPLEAGTAASVLQEPAATETVSAASVETEQEPVPSEAEEAAPAPEPAAVETASALPSAGIPAAERVTAPAFASEEMVEGSTEFIEQEKLHSEAKRLARLAVSEIKLYNEQRVREGRQHRDLYVRLKKDIDSSRDWYEKRVAAVVARKVDYFHDELIRILGENDPSALGSDYPGPRGES